MNVTLYMCFIVQFLALVNAGIALFLLFMIPNPEPLNVKFEGLPIKELLGFC